MVIFMPSPTIRSMLVVYGFIPTYMSNKESWESTSNRSVMIGMHGYSEHFFLALYFPGKVIVQSRTASVNHSDPYACLLTEAKARRYPPQIFWQYSARTGSLLDDRNYLCHSYCLSHCLSYLPSVAKMFI